MKEYERKPMGVPVDNAGRSSRQRVKICTHCKIQKRLSSFPGNKRNSDGYDQICRECRAARMRELRRKKNPELEEQERLRKERNTLRMRQRDPFQMMVNAARTRAAHSGVSFSISANDLLLLWKSTAGICPISGQQMTLEVADGRGNRSPNKASLDRIVPSLGYTPENVRLVCWAVNCMKAVMTDEELFRWCTSIVSRLANRHTL